MKNSILPKKLCLSKKVFKVTPTKLSQFVQKASVLVPTRRDEMSVTFFVFFAERIGRMHYYAVKRDLFLKNVVVHTILEMLSFYSMYFC